MVFDAGENTGNSSEIRNASPIVGEPAVGGVNRVVVVRTSDLNRAIASSAGVVLHNDAVSDSPLSVSGHGEQSGESGPGLPSQRLKRGVERVQEDVADGIDPAIIEVFGTQAAFEDRVRHLADPRLNEPAKFKDLLTRVMVFIQRDRIVSYASRRDNKGIPVGEAQREAADIIRKAFETPDAHSLITLLSDNDLWIPQEDEKNSNAA